MFSDFEFKTLKRLNEEDRAFFMVITDILARNARSFGPDTALVERVPAAHIRREITWSEFDDTASRLANALMDRGMRKGGRAVHLMMNCLEWLPVYFGILRCGAWAVPLNFRFLAPAIARCIRVSEARVVIFGPEFIERLEEVRKETHPVRHWIYTGDPAQKPQWAEQLETVVRNASPRPPEIPIGITDSAALYFTSGTTGNPKAVHLTHRNLEFSCYAENSHHRQTRKDNFLCLPPLYHTGAKMHWFGNFIAGAPSVILKGVKPRWILEAVSQEHVTIVWLLVPWAHDILIAIENGEVNLADYELEQWRLMHIGAQPVPPSLIRKWKEIFPYHAYDTNYGLTEATGPGCVHLGIENTRKVGAIGVPGFDWECRILPTDPAERVDGDGKLRLDNVADGEPGELAVRGPGVMKEYYGNAEATAATLKDGWLFTGDIARKDEDGFIWLVDRAKDVIITGGENIFPVEIEEFIMESDEVQDTAVIGLPDDRLGEIVAAVVQVKPGREMSEPEFFARCEGLARYKRPRRIFFDKVPRNPTGKIEKPALRKKYAGK